MSRNKTNNLKSLGTISKTLSVTLYEKQAGTTVHVISTVQTEKEQEGYIKTTSLSSKYMDGMRPLMDEVSRN